MGGHGAHHAAEGRERVGPDGVGRVHIGGDTSAGDAGVAVHLVVEGVDRWCLAREGVLFNGLMGDHFFSVELFLAMPVDDK